MGIDDEILDPLYELPDTLPIFPLSSALLLPGCRIPLKIFEPRYLQMIDDALAGDRLIGVIQPLDPNTDADDSAVHGIGCAGRIVSMRETDDGRYFVQVIGVSRFEVMREVNTDKLYRLVEPLWDRYGDDVHDQPQMTIDREELVANLRAYFAACGLEANWEAIDESEDEDLVNSLAMACPFDATEKQALLEAADSEQRSRLVIALMNMAVLQGGIASDTVH